jgi:hypothetical protein
MASAFGGRAVSWGEVGRIRKRRRWTKRKTARRSCLPLPLPILLPHFHTEFSTSRVNVLDPPPLSNHNVVRGRATTDAVVPPSGTEDGIAAPEINDPSASATSHIDLDKAEPNASDSPQRPSMKTPLLHRHPKLPHRRSQHGTPSLPNRVHYPSKITFPAHCSAPHDAYHAYPHRALDVSRPTLPFTPLLARIATTNFTSCESRSQPFMLGIACTRDVPIVWTLYRICEGNVGLSSLALLRGCCYRPTLIFPDFSLFFLTF